MRRYLKRKREAEDALNPSEVDTSATGTKVVSKGETLAQGMEDEVDRNLPDYYEPLTVIPDIAPRLQWIEDGEGQVINQHEEMLQLVPQGHFVAPHSQFSTKFDNNLRQMQETRKLCSKISVIKQMQIQTQVSPY